MAQPLDLIFEENVIEKIDNGILLVLALFTEDKTVTADDLLDVIYVTFVLTWALSIPVIVFFTAVYEKTIILEKPFF